MTPEPKSNQSPEQIAVRASVPLARPRQKLTAAFYMIVDMARLA
jgi:hypothetical protein